MTQDTDTYEDEGHNDEEDVLFDGDITELENLNGGIFEESASASSSRGTVTPTPSIRKRKYNSQSSAAIGLINSAVKALEEQSKQKIEDDLDLFGK